MFREAHAIWRGGPYAGEGTVSTPSGVLNSATYAFGALGGAQRLSSPCELLAAAIASCMATTVAIQMAKVGINPVVVDTYAVLTLDNAKDRWEITSSHLEITVRTTEPQSSRFQEAVEAARRECPVSAVLKMDLICKAKLVSLTTPAVV
ncbi:MAG TPA: OsmC family peroxiredoxin [Terriglobales bacterium]|nr:OsmC family peroxiredoxin [Terriglobales bacterium]